MTEFIDVPVPAHLVTDVMAYIARRSYASREGVAEAGRRKDEPTTVRSCYGRFHDRSIDRLRQVHVSREPGPQMVADVLDVLEGRPDERVSLSELARATGREPASVKSSLAAFTKWVKKELDDLTEPRNRPINYQALPGDQVFKETHYWITVATAERWRQLRQAA